MRGQIDSIFNDVNLSAEQRTIELRNLMTSNFKGSAADCKCSRSIRDFGAATSKP
jgi:hypothetical protein